MVDRRTTACTTADRVKPRIRAQRISHVMDPASANAWPTASRRLVNHRTLHFGPRQHSTPQGYAHSAVVVPTGGPRSSRIAADPREADIITTSVQVIGTISSPKSPTHGPGNAVTEATPGTLVHDDDARREMPCKEVSRPSTNWAPLSRKLAAYR